MLIALLYRIYNTVILFFFLCFILLSELELKDYFVLNSIFLIIFLGMEFMVKRTVSFLMIWVAGFLLIINSEGLLDYKELEIYGPTALFTAKLLIVSNLVVILVNKLSGSSFKFVMKSVSPEPQIKLPRLSLKKILIIEIVYLLLTLPLTIAAYTNGRHTAFESNEISQSLLYVIFVAPIAVLLPTYVLLYFSSHYKGSKSILFSLLLSAPVFASLVIQGTRFLILYSFVFFIVNFLILNKGSRKTKLVVFVFALIMQLLTAYMRDLRVGGVSENLVIESSDEIGYNNYDPNYIIATFGSPEGVIASNIKQVNYFQEYDFKYGLSTGYIFYFWIPRSVWPDKPTMLGHWLIRSIGEKGFADTHSVSFGYIGEIYSDFGLIGCFIASLVFGYVLFIFERKTQRATVNYKLKTIWIFLLYPYVFFFIRSPVTASINLFAFIVMCYILNNIIIKKGDRVKDLGLQAR